MFGVQKHGAENFLRFDVSQLLDDAQVLDAEGFEFLAQFLATFESIKLLKVKIEVLDISIFSKLLKTSDHFLDKVKLFNLVSFLVTLDLSLDNSLEATDLLGGIGLSACVSLEVTSN